MDFRLKQIPKMRAFPRPEDGLRAVVEKAPQAEAWRSAGWRKPAPCAARFMRAAGDWRPAGFLVVTLWLFLHVMFGANGMVVYRSKRAEYQRLQAEMDRLQKENDLYTQQIRALQNDPKAIEKEAREQLHYTRPGEVVYVDPSPQKPATNAARK